MRVGSFFSGIGGLDYGLARAGHEHVFFCEWDPWRREVLRARWPGVPVYPDIGALGKPAWGTLADEAGASVDFRGWEAGTGLFCGGFPCQDVSVAGRRAGLAGERTGLFFEFARCVDAVRPSWILVENVPGLFSSNGGRDFGVVLGTLADLGYGLAWRVLDSRFFGVPQRRRRVFIVGAVADGDPRAAAERAGEVLAVGSGCERHLAKGREARPDVASTLGGGAGERGWPQDVERMTFLPTKPTGSLTANGGDGHFNDADAGRLVAAPLTKGSATGEGVNQPGRRQEDDVNIVAFHPTGGGAKGLSASEDVAPGTGTGTGGTVSIATAVGVRRLTPTECERLQGLPDGWTQLGGTPDSRRYSALGDAVTVQVAEWIGRRLP